MKTETPASTLTDLRVRDLEPYPDVQRPLQTKRWQKKTGRFDATNVGTIMACPNGKPGRYFVIDGQHRVAELLRAVGPEAVVHAEVFSRMLSKEEAAKAFVTRSTNVAISTGVLHDRRVAYKEPDAMFVESIRSQLPGTRAIKPFYVMLSKGISHRTIQNTVNWLITIWGPKADYPGLFITAAANLNVKVPPSPATRKSLRQRKPIQWLGQARIARLQTVGARDKLSNYVKDLLERRIR